MRGSPFQFSDHFLAERCNFCGRCFAECPVLEMPLEEAQREIRSLVETGDSPVLTRCVGCMACNSLCPTDANPHTLIVSRWHARCRQEGVPARGRLVLPYQKPNLYTLMIEALPDDEQALVREWQHNWEQPARASTMIYAGCNLLIQPLLMQSKLYEGIPIFGSTDLCCGEPLYRMGSWDAMAQVARHMKTELEKIGFQKLIVPCLAGYHLMKHVYPEVFGVTLNFEIVSVVDWLLERLDRSEIAFQRLNPPLKGGRGDVDLQSTTGCASSATSPLPPFKGGPYVETSSDLQADSRSVKAVIHDSCWPKASGNRLFDATRDLLARLGVEVIEPPHTRDTALCCGMCAPAARFSLRDALNTAKRRLRELDQTDADWIVVDCAGCNWLFAVANRFPGSGTSKPIYDLLELVQMGVGEKPLHRTEQRAQQIIATLWPKLLRSYLTRGRFQPSGPKSPDASG